MNRIFSTDNSKALKADKYGYLNAIHYLAPASSGGAGNLCSHASPGCIALCLGWYSGQAGMVKDLEHGSNSVRASRQQKAQRFMHNRARYLLDLVRELDGLERKADKWRKQMCVRLNGSSDIGWEGIHFVIGRGLDDKAFNVQLGGSMNIFEHYPNIQFVDYTKNPRRFDRKLPANYWLTFSHSEINEADCLKLLARGFNVAVAFDHMPLSWRGHIVVDGDKHDLRHLDPRAEDGAPGYVIRLVPRGRKAKRDTSGFVVRQ